MDENYKSTTVVIPTLDIFIHDQWELTKGITAPRFSIVDNVYPNQEFQVIIMIGDYEIVKGKISVGINCHIENEEGHTVSQNDFERTLVADLEEYIGFILLPELPQFNFGKTDAEGEYTIVVTINDANSGKEEILKSKISLHTSSPNKFIELEGELEGWRQNYYLDPKPNELISYYLQSMDEIGMNDNANIQFYVEALNNALFLIEDIDQLLIKDELPQKKRNAISLLIARSNYRGPDLSGFSKPELEIHHQVREEDEGAYNPLLEEALTHPTELDILWSMFFANGKYENIEKIISALSYTEGRSIEEVKNAPQADMIQYAVGMASSWSLGLNGESHPLIKTYMIHTVNKPEMSEHIRSELITILENTEEE
ncbi:MAG: hypothetical protein GQ574_07285 [Crocinitomix sp.]|nr:hypothetical protein [Crocinitomix sp.]